MARPAITGTVELPGSSWQSGTKVTIEVVGYRGGVAFSAAGDAVAGVREAMVGQSLSWTIASVRPNTGSSGDQITDPPESAYRYTLFVPRPQDAQPVPLFTRHFAVPDTAGTLDIADLWIDDPQITSVGDLLMSWLLAHDGDGSGLDADKVDGKHASYFAANAALLTAIADAEAGTAAALTAANAYTDEQLAELALTDPDTIDTLNEIRDLLGPDPDYEDFLSALVTQDEKAAANGVATLDADSTLTAAQVPFDIVARRQFFDPRDYGAVLSAVTDNTTAIQAAIDAASAANGGTVLIPGRMGFSGHITVPRRVNLVGYGVELQSADSYGSSTLFALHADAQLEFTGSGRRGVSSGFGLHGNEISNRTDGLLRFTGGAHCRWDSIMVSDCAGAGILVTETQNSVFSNMTVSRVGGNGWIFGEYCRSNTFIGCSARRVGGCHYLIGRYPAPVIGLVAPSNNVWINPILEEAFSTSNAAVIRCDAGLNNQFLGGVFIGGAIDSGDSMIQLNAGVIGFTGTFRLNGHTGQRSHIRISADGENGADCWISGQMGFLGGNYAITYNGGGMMLPSKYTMGDGLSVLFDTTGTGNVATASSARLTWEQVINIRQNIRWIATGTGPVLTSPNGTRYRIAVDNSGVLSTTTSGAS